MHTDGNNVTEKRINRIMAVTKLFMNSNEMKLSFL